MSAPTREPWPPIGNRLCPKCSGSGSGPSEWHYVRGHGIHNDCSRCDGDGYVRNPDDARIELVTDFIGAACIIAMPFSLNFIAYGFGG